MKANEQDLKDYMFLPREGLYVGMKLTFNIHIFLANNGTLIPYCAEGDTLGEHEIDNIQKVPESSLRVLKKEYAGFLDSQKARLQDVMKSGDVQGPAAKAAAGSIIKGLQLNLMNESVSRQDQSAVASEMLNGAVKIVSDLILQLKNNPSAASYEQILKGAENATDPLTVHNYQVSGIGVLILMTVGCTNMEEMIDLGVAGLLHDLGMSGISNSLTDLHLDGEDIENPAAKIAFMRHTEIVFEMLKEKKKDISPGAKRMIEQHHENMDGSGFKGTFGGQIYMPARILRIADDLCVCLTSKKHPTTMPKALGILKNRNGTASNLPLYDTQILDVLIKTMR